MSEGAEDYARLLALAKSDPNVLALLLGGSRGVGRETQHSDYDVFMIVRDEVLQAYRERYDGLKRLPGIDGVVMSLDQFEAHAAWDGPTAWNRYSFVHIQTLVDKTGRVPALLAAKACVPKEHLSAFVDARADHFVNQVYRSAKCARDGLTLASRLEAAEALPSLLDLLFALDGGRLRPFPKYLVWELEMRPLTALPWSTAEFLAMLERIVGHGDQADLQAVLRMLEPRLRETGHAAVLDGWGDTLPWLLNRET